MLAALTSVGREEDMAVVQRLFRMGSVNAKASQVCRYLLPGSKSRGLFHFWSQMSVTPTFPPEPTPALSPSFPFPRRDRQPSCWPSATAARTR